MKILPVVILIIAILPSCDRQKVIASTKSQGAYHFVYAREPDDSTDYKHIKYDFYVSKTGHLFERKLAMARDSACHCQFQVYYDSTLSIFTDNTNVSKRLSSVVDINSFVQLASTEFSKDKNNVYYFFGNSDGGNRAIVKDADPKTFRRLCEYRWGIDKSYVFYQDKKLKGLNLKRLQVLHLPDTSDHFVTYIKDDKIVYHEEDILQGADAKTCKIVNGQKWAAEDKNKKYR